MKKLSFIIISALALSACSSPYSSIGETQYLQSKNGPNLVVPPPMTTNNISHFYNLPVQTQDPRVNIEPII